ncbi:SAV_2336 N-terminal domain-related protein [Amycolatopsis sp. MtRt-6]|uniref:SAV_2336 N-terminal domain-related protein n=1 Tax=Amycolatopsis sp. MtRt-6 TaxID=2792782 RepID=UPI001A908B6D|nr:SAV_2336 N-terminal domain-related protein [Amycolatopsis sp. MtRt-6]
MIERLARALRQAGVDTDAVQLAEILWVATRRTPDPVRSHQDEAQEAPELLDAPAPGPIPPRPLTREPEEIPEPSPRYLVPQRSAPGEAVEVRLPAPVALPGRLRLGRALRAFKQRHPASRLQEFDLDATIELYGDTGLLVPLLRPGSERWFDVTLVVDAGPTMDVWAQTTAELARLLAGHGAFRRVRRLRLVDEDGEPWLLTDAGQRQHPGRVGSHDGRRLTMVISDCVGAPWYGETLWPIIRQWGRRGPVVLVQTLPPRLWESTALGPVDVRVSGYRPGQPNSGLRVTWPWWSLGGEDQPGGVVPVVALTEPDLARWARMVMGHADVPVAGVPVGPAYDEPDRPSEISAAARVAAVKATVSVEAYQLAVCLAAVPIRLPVARMVQYAILGSHDPVHLAEVFASGLIRRLDPADLPPDEVAYDFVPGVREVLQGSLTGSRTLEIFRAVAQYLERTIGASASFTALLTGVTGETEADPAFLPFAEVGASLLDRLGLRSAPVSAASPPVPSAPAGLPWAHAILIGDHDLEEFWVWLRDNGFPVERITWLRGDFVRESFQHAVREAAAQQPVTGLLFVLMLGRAQWPQREVAVYSELALVPALTAFPEFATVTLTQGEPMEGWRIDSPPRAAVLGYSGVSVPEVVSALSGGAMSERGTVTGTSLDRFLGSRATDAYTLLNENHEVVLRPVPERPRITRCRAVAVGLEGGAADAKRLGKRLSELGYEARVQADVVTTSPLIADLDWLAEGATEQDLLWLHVSADCGMAMAEDDVGWMLDDGAFVTLADIRDVFVASGAGAVVITDETRELAEFTGSSRWNYGFRDRSGERVRNFLRISALASRAKNGLVSRLLDLLAHEPHEIEWRSVLAESGSFYLAPWPVTRWGELAVSIAPDPAAVVVADLRLVEVPEGDFFSGMTEGQLVEISGEFPDAAGFRSSGETVFVPSFSISKFPITNRQFARFVAATVWKPPHYWEGATPPDEIADHPVVRITAVKARAYCYWLAQQTGEPFRLPTALEWEKAARGTDARRFPWGDEFDPARCSHRRRSTVPVTAFSPEGDSPYGVADTVGNVREWTSTVKVGNYGNEYVVVCGGGMYIRDEHELWCNHSSTLADGPKASIGFRVALGQGMATATKPRVHQDP